MRRSERWTRISVLFLVAALAGACSMLRLREELNEAQETLTLFSGSISRETLTPGPVIVVLYRVDEGNRVSQYDLLPGEGEYHLLDNREDGAIWRILAFVDSNEDFVYQDEEPLGYLEGAPLDVLRHPAGHAQGVIHLPESGWESPELDIDLSEGALGALKPGRRAALGRVASLDDPRFSEEISEKGMWEPLTFLNEAHGGIYFLGPYDPQKIPVLFVHGIGGSPRDWAPVIEHLDGDRFQPWFFYYPSGLRLEANGWILTKLVEEVRHRQRFERLFVVAHSMGGLVSRAFINQYRVSHSPRYVELFVSISTPWQGHEASAMGAEMSPVVMPVWNDLVPGSTFLDNLFENPFPENLDYKLLFSHVGSSVFTPGADDGVVSLESQLRYEAQDLASTIYGFSEGHTSILETERLHSMLSGFLAKAAER